MSEQLTPESMREWEERLGPEKVKLACDILCSHGWRSRLANKLIEIAARRSVESPLGWACPDCETLQDAARILRGEPEPKPDDGRADAVLSREG
jgi:hypothetical protein